MLLLSLQNHDYARERIRWVVVHWPPIMELDESKRIITGGLAGFQQTLLQKELTEYDHENVNMVWNRFWTRVKKGRHLCNSMTLKNREREKYVYFSIPRSITLPIRIIMTRENALKLGNPSSLSLVKLLRDKRFRGLLSSKRSFTKEIDDLLLKKEKRSNIKRMIMRDEAIIRMLARDGTDYILEYPDIVSTFMKKYYPEKRKDMVYILIKEIRPFNYGYVSCTRDEWGKRVIGQVNRALIKLRPTREFKNSARRRYDGDQLIEYMYYYNNYLLKITK